MPKVRVNCFAVSLDGYAAGPRQALETPLGIRGPELFEWFFSTRTWKQMQGYEGGSTGVDNEWAQRGMENVGAWILGRNMFGPVRGPWPDDSWKGWWGEEPPYHVPTFVLTHHPRKPVEMKGGTTFYFVTDGIHATLELARDAAKDKDVRIGGGVATIQQYLRARLIDELHLAFRPILMGSGENLFASIDLTELGYRCKQHVSTELAMHVVVTKEARLQIGYTELNPGMPLPEGAKPGPLYQLLRQKNSGDDHTFEVQFLDPGIQVFTFG